MKVFTITGYGKTADKIVVRVTTDEQEAEIIKEDMKNFFQEGSQERYIVTINEFEV
jgi:hypothetical protein